MAGFGCLRGVPERVRCVPGRGSGCLERPLASPKDLEEPERRGQRTESDDGENEPLDVVQRFDVPPTVTLTGGTKLSVWVILALAAGRPDEEVSHF